MAKLSALIRVYFPNWWCAGSCWRGAVSAADDKIVIPTMRLAKAITKFDDKVRGPAEAKSTSAGC